MSCIVVYFYWHKNEIVPTRLNGVSSTKICIIYGKFCFENMALKDVQYEMTFCKNIKSASAPKYLALTDEYLNTSVWNVSLLNFRKWERKETAVHYFQTNKILFLSSLWNTTDFWYRYLCHSRIAERTCRKLATGYSDMLEGFTKML